MNNIYLVEDKKRDYPVQDIYTGFVVIAKNPKAARLLCPNADEGDIWKNPKLTTIKHIGKSKKKQGVILESFNAG